MNPSPWLVLAIPIFAVAAPVQADPLQDALNLVQPTQFAGTYDNATNTVMLTWQAPDAQAWTYELYRDGELLATLTDLSFIDSAPSQAASYYALFATAPNQSVSISSAVVQTTCPPVSTWNDDDPPFVGVGIHDECIITP